MIDVSQSVENDHPQALEFLRKDCRNMTDFFRRNGVCTMTTKELFDFITDITINEENVEDYLEKAQERAKNRFLAGKVSVEEEIAEAVFHKMFIPKSLDEVSKYEEDYDTTKSGGVTEGILYQTITGMKQDLSGPRSQPQLLQGNVKLYKGVLLTCK